MSTPSAAAPTPQPTTESTTPAPSAPSAPEASERRYTQEDVNRLIDQRMAKERDARDRDAAKQKEADETERKRQQGEWQSLAEGHQRRVTELEALSGQYDAQLEQYRKALAKHNRARLSSWSEAARAAIPHGEDDDPLDVAEQIDRWDPVVNAIPRGIRAPGAAASPAPAGGVPETAALESEKARLRGRGGYAP